MRYWLFKTEPGCFSWQDLQKAPGQVTSWDGVRNYQARNLMREMRLGDQGFFYHSGAKPEIVGIVEVVREAYPDHTSWDPEAGGHFDPASTPEKPRWFMVDVKLVQAFPQPLSRKSLAGIPELAGMELMRRGSRLSVQPVEEAAFRYIVNLAEHTLRQ